MRLVRVVVESSVMLLRRICVKVAVGMLGRELEPDIVRVTILTLVIHGGSCEH